MKWPNELTVIRHGESAYNVLRPIKEADAKYQAFKKAFDANEDPELVRQLAEEIVAEGTLTLDHGDHDTPLTDWGHEQALLTGKGLRLGNVIGLPDIIYVSPYNRTKDTLEGIKEGWPELEDVPVVEEERLREQDHGLSIIYNDWRIYQTMHPEQRALYDAQGAYWYRFLQGENVPDVRERTRSWIGTVVREHTGQNVMAVAHHLTKLALRANFERFGEEQFIWVDNNEKPVNCGVTKYVGVPEAGKNGKLVLDIYNNKFY